LKDIDGLLAQREALVNANPDHPAHKRAMIEGRILQAMRAAFLNEYGHFSADSRSIYATQNLFLFLNAAYNTVAAVGADYAYRSLDTPRLNGTANILFIVFGGMAAVTPVLCTSEMWVHRQLILHANRKLGASENAVQDIAKARAELESAGNDGSGSLMPSFPETQRLAVYTESNKLFAKQLENETTTMNRLNKIALQNSLAGPAIGGLLMTQGLLGTVGYYKYFPKHPKRQFDLDYKGAVCGTVGSSMALAGNAALFLSSLSYEHHLNAKKQLPQQLINERLKHLDELQKVVSAI
jgi:hypothetical protein